MSWVRAQKGGFIKVGYSNLKASVNHCSFLHRSGSQTHLEGFLAHRVVGINPRDPCWLGLVWILRVCISHKHMPMPLVQPHLENHCLSGHVWALPCPTWHSDGNGAFESSLFKFMIEGFYKNIFFQTQEIWSNHKQGTEVDINIRVLTLHIYVF